MLLQFIECLLYYVYYYEVHHIIRLNLHESPRPSIHGLISMWESSLDSENRVFIGVDFFCLEKKQEQRSTRNCHFPFGITKTTSHRRAKKDFYRIPYSAPTCLQVVAAKLLTNTNACFEEASIKLAPW